MATKGQSQKSLRHVSSEDVAAFLEQSLSAKERNLVIQHLAQCNRCRKLVTGSVRSQRAVRDPDERSA